MIICTTNTLVGPRTHWLRREADQWEDILRYAIWAAVS